MNGDEPTVAFRARTKKAAGRKVRPEDSVVDETNTAQDPDTLSMSAIDGTQIPDGLANLQIRSASLFQQRRRNGNKIFSQSTTLRKQIAAIDPFEALETQRSSTSVSNYSKSTIEALKSGSSRQSRDPTQLQALETFDSDHLFEVDDSPLIVEVEIDPQKDTDAQLLAPVFQDYLEVQGEGESLIQNAEVSGEPSGQISPDLDPEMEAWENAQIQRAYGTNNKDLGYTQGTASIKVPQAWKPESLATILAQHDANLATTQAEIDQNENVMKLQQMMLDTADIHKLEHDAKLKSSRFNLLFFQEMQAWAEALTSFYEQKMPLLERIEVDFASQLRAKQIQLSQRRHDIMTTTKHAKLSADGSYHSGLSELELNTYNENMSLLASRLRALFDDIGGSDFRDPRKGPLKQIQKWREEQRDDYDKMTGCMSLVRSLEWYGRAELAVWNIFNTNTQPITQFIWYRTLFEYGKSEGMDEHLLPAEFLHLYVLQRTPLVFADAWDVYSQQASDRVLDFIMQIQTSLIEEDPRTRPAMIALIQTFLKRLEQEAILFRTIRCSRSALPSSGDPASLKYYLDCNQKLTYSISIFGSLCNTFQLTAHARLLVDVLQLGVQEAFASWKGIGATWAIAMQRMVPPLLFPPALKQKLEVDASFIQ